MGRISGRTADMSSGKLNPGTYQFSETKWEEKEKNGNDNIWWTTTFLDLDGNPHPFSLFATQTVAFGTNDRTVEVNKKGQLVTIEEATTLKLNRNIGAGKFFDSLDKHGFSPTKLRDVDINPGGFDGQWIKIDTVAQTGGKVDQNGNPYTDVVCTEILGDSPGGGKKGSAAAGKSTSATAKKAALAPEPEPDEEESAEESDDNADALGTDEEIEAASGYVLSTVADPATYIKNYLADSDGSGTINIKPLAVSVYQKFVKEFGGDKKLTGKVASLVGNPEFHEQYSGDGGWTFNAEDGDVVVPAPEPVKKGGGKKK